VRGDTVVAKAKFKKGQKVCYRGSWGTGPSQAAVVRGTGTKIGTKGVRQRVYDVKIIGAKGMERLKWGYSDQVRKMPKRGCD
jgi:hypothetical protein